MKSQTNVDVFITNSVVPCQPQFSFLSTNENSYSYSYSYGSSVVVPGERLCADFLFNAFEKESFDVIESCPIICAEENEDIIIRLCQTKDKRLQSLGSTDESVVDKTDILTGRYEGGFKLWECSLDLVRYLSKQGGLKGVIKPGSKGTVLELGCGHGVPGVYLAMQGAASVCFQDLNREVLLHHTMRNVYLNAPDSLASSIFVSGDWRDFEKVVPATMFFDLIVSAETVYNEEAFPVLHKILESYLARDGRAILAAKRFYFGVGGGLSLFKSFVEQKGIFRVKTKESFETGNSNVRDIVELEYFEA